MKPEFHRTVNILVQAYLNDTLEHADCSACAVGNIVSASMGFKMIKAGEMYDSVTKEYFPRHEWIRGDDFVKPEWQQVFCTLGKSKHQTYQPWNYKGLSREQIESTGYSALELARIEYVFERAPYGKNRAEWMFNGLMAVVDVLADIHSVDLSVREDAKLLFAKP